jgi:hypothetical protein
LGVSPPEEALLAVLAERLPASPILAMLREYLLAVLATVVVVVDVTM